VELALLDTRRRHLLIADTVGGEVREPLQELLFEGICQFVDADVEVARIVVLRFFDSLCSDFKGFRLQFES